ncbi:MAG: ATP-binding protein [Myxococcota bacterium]|nr:ATP-binding protein [Myxococcota bacterium]
MRPRPLQALDLHAFPILYVDDEPDNLRVFELTFRREFTVLTASSAEEGMEILNANPIAVVLSDQRMPGVTGVEFLARARSLDPRVIRMLVTAYGDVEILGNAINDGSIYRYIPKPWEPEDMRLTLRRAIETYALDEERTALLRELETINRLSRSLHQEMDLGRLVGQLLNVMHKDLGFDGGALLFFDEEGDNLRWKSLFPAESELSSCLRKIELTRPEASDFLDRVLLGHTQRLSMQDVEDYEGPVHRWLTEVSAEELLVIPLMGKKGVVGALAVDNRSGSRGFGPGDLRLLDGLATQAVVALENARLVEDLRAARAQVQRADRLGTLGTLAAGLAHEINNPLVSINTFVNLAPEMREERDDAFWGDYHRLALGELARLRGLVGRMAGLGSGDSPDPTGNHAEVDMGQTARDVTALLEGQAARGQVRLVCQELEEPLRVKGDRDQLHQVLLNLVLNGLAATPAGGTVEVGILRDPQEPESWLQIRVRDEGCGIAGDDLERIFDPFFTTKSPDGGSGLGLMVVHQIVSEHGGSIEVKSQLDLGTVFRVRLPQTAVSTAPPSRTA